MLGSLGFVALDEGILHSIEGAEEPGQVKNQSEGIVIESFVEGRVWEVGLSLQDLFLFAQG